MGRFAQFEENHALMVLLILELIVLSVFGRRRRGEGGE